MIIRQYFIPNYIEHLSETTFHILLLTKKSNIKGLLVITNNKDDECKTVISINWTKKQISLYRHR